MLPKGTVLFSSRAPIGYCAIAENELCTNQGFKSVVPNEDTSSLFLYYLLVANKDAIAGVGSGTTFPEVSGKVMKQFEVVIPEDIDEQEAIASVLGSIDDKIELNNRLNDYLFELIQALYGRYCEQCASKVTVGDIAEVIDCLHSKKPDKQSEGRQLLQLDNIRNDGLLDIEKQYLITEEDYQHWITRCEARQGDCVITNVGRVGAASQVPPNVHAALGRNMTCVRPLESRHYPTLLITALTSRSMKAEIERKTDTGTIMNALNVRNIPKLEIPFRDDEFAKGFEKQVRPLQAMREHLLEESRQLARLRDTLLPKLMSGEIDVSKVAI